jgi:hypothetical protein
MRRLNVVVPYRNRETHFRQFVSHVRAYFARDKADRNIPYRVTIVEQEPGLPLNAGALKNIGFSLGNEETDYTCFHDIDYLPVWADYSWVEQPTPILWHGAETRPIAPGRSPARVKLNLEKFFGGVVLVPNDVFLRAGGYSNDYWGWGYEDVDLRTRFDVARIGIGRRKGTFTALDHDSDAFTLDGKHSEISAINRKTYEANWAGSDARRRGGLSTLDFVISSHREIPEADRPERAASWEIVTVRLNMQPSPAQIAAAGAPAEAPRGG